MTYIYNFDEPPALSAEETTRLLGGKGANLAVMRTQLGLPVPPGFTITTEAGLAYLATGWSSDLEAELRDQVGRVETAVGRHFGQAGEPLLVSVRSGAAISMPGMMDTILNIGFTDSNEKALGVACGNSDFAAQSRRRFLAMYRTIVGVDTVPANPWDQLRGAIQAVFESWNTPRAKAYRRREGISDDLGTAVTIQAMVFGNMDDESGTGVLFTRNPATGDHTPYGDLLFRAQGEDVVAGTHAPQSIDQLADRLPEVAAELERHAATLERHFRDVCDIEFTIERAKLWLLQVRVGKRSPHAALKFAVDMANEEDFPLSKAEAVKRVAKHLVDPPVVAIRMGEHGEALASGLAASPGLACGRIATTAEMAVTMADTGDDVVLVRPETSPDDVHGMACSRGILTSRGGLASHAAVVARGWGIPAVVGAEAVEIRGTTVVIGNQTFAEGDTITIDGGSGQIFGGRIESEATFSPETQTLLDWATELDLDIETLGADTEHGVASGDDTTEVTADEAIRALHLKGFATPDGLAPVLVTPVDPVAAVLEALDAEGMVRRVGEMYQLSDTGKERGAALMAADREAWTVERAAAALDGFLPLDAQMKEIVTAWQMREVDGQPVLNDHSDDEYDRSVLNQFFALHDETRSWLETLTADLGRLATYVARLDRAVDAVRDGNHTFIASPRIDSYHNAWFELHEDLIQLSGRTREEETAAGRA